MLKPEVYNNNQSQVNKTVTRINKKNKFLIFKYLQFGLKMKKIIFEELIDVYENKNYKIFDSGIPYNLSIGGIRTNDKIFINRF